MALNRFSSGGSAFVDGHVKLSQKWSLENEPLGN